MVKRYIYILVDNIYVAKYMKETTTIRVSKNTLKMLERLRKNLGANSFNETIRLLIMQYRESRLEEAFGLDKEKVKPFSEEDRGEDRN